MTCPRCQHENPATVKFCGECGARLDIACAACRAPNPPANKFCHECGAPMAPKPASGPLASPESYTPKHLAEKILTSKAALEGERKQVTVLFADLKGSMELLADRDPEDARRLLDPVLEHMMEAVHRYEGTVNQVMGDGIMALFGAPVAHEDHAARACYAALRMQESVKKYAEEVRRSHAAVVKIRVRLNSGEVVVRAIGSDLRMDYTAVGQTTHLAARMEQLADPGAIVIPPDTLALVEGYVEVKSLGLVPVKGQGPDAAQPDPLAAQTSVRDGPRLRAGPGSESQRRPGDNARATPSANATRENQRRPSACLSPVAVGAGDVRMRIIWITALVLALAIALVVSAGWAQGFGSPAPERYFRVEVEGGQGRSGRPVVRGYIYNDGPQAAGRVQLAVESLDAAGQVINRSILPLDGVVPAFNRLYFDIRVSTAGATYRVSVYYYEWLKGGGGGAGLAPEGLRG